MVGQAGLNPGQSDPRLTGEVAQQLGMFLQDRTPSIPSDTGRGIVEIWREARGFPAQVKRVDSQNLQRGPALSVRRRHCTDVQHVSELVRRINAGSSEFGEDCSDSPNELDLPLVSGMAWHLRLLAPSALSRSIALQKQSAGS